MSSRLCQQSTTNPWRGPMDIVRWWFFKPKRSRCRYRLGRPQRHPHRKIPSLRLQNIQWPSRVWSHPHRPIPRPRSRCQNANVENRFQTHSGTFKWRIPDQRPHPPTILSPGSKCYTICFQTSLHPAHPPIWKHQSRHIIQTGQHQAKKPTTGQPATSNTSEPVTPRLTPTKVGLLKPPGTQW